ncbi:MAG: hypothetical protein MI861_11125, partial [Pirellulales bacterium]|nr:hypothetical protein [Pirellulales bacterium]
MSDQQQRAPGSGGAEPNGRAQPTEIESKDPDLPDSSPETPSPETKSADAVSAPDKTGHEKPSETAKPVAAPSNGGAPSPETGGDERAPKAGPASTTTDVKPAEAETPQDEALKTKAPEPARVVPEPAKAEEQKLPEARAPESKSPEPQKAELESLKEVKQPPKDKAPEQQKAAAEPLKEVEQKAPEEKTPKKAKKSKPDPAKIAEKKVPEDKATVVKAPEPEPVQPAPPPKEAAAVDGATPDKQKDEKKTADRTPSDDDEEEAATGYKINDPQELARNMIRLFEEGSRLFSTLSEKTEANPSGPYTAVSEMGEASKVLGAVATQWLREPGKLVEAQGKLASAYVDLWGRSVRRFLGEEDVEPAAKPDPTDARFRDPDWSASPYFDFWKQAYLLTAQWADEMVDKTEGLDPKTKHRAEFYLHQIESALSPSNFVFFNPEVVRETLGSNGENLVQGLKHLSEDLQQSDDVLRISQTDLDAFEVGENLAITPGKVVFQNDIIQLIQYTPTTKKVHATPLLIVPPWINKFYILDLVPKKSFIKWVVEQGFTLFVISWVNPDKRLAEKTFEDYMHEGILAATDAACEATGEKQVNTLGYCVGGTLLATALAWMAAKGDERIKSA